MGIVQLQAPAHFNAAVEKHWDEEDTATHSFVPPNAIVSRVAWTYLLDATVQIAVNDTGPTVRRRVCSGTDFDCNFWLGDAILVASDPSPSSDALLAPIRLKFSHGVRAVGAWVGVSAKDPFDTRFFDQPLMAALWVALEADPLNWHFMNANGWTGHVVPVGTALTAPFVAARATGSDRIVEVRFDASLLGNRRFGKIALSDLSVEL